MPEIFEYDFMNRALIGAALVGAAAPAFGVYLVLRRLSLIADTLSHVALAGVAIALLTSASTPHVARGATSGAAISIEELRARRLLPGDAALAVFLYGALAIAVVLISLAEGFNASLFSYLFGSILTVSTTDLWLLGGLVVAVALFLLLMSAELAQTSFDTDLARSRGVRVHLVNVLLAVITGATITLSMRVVGVLLVGALIVVPVLISLRLAKGLTQTVLLSSALGVAISVSGIVIAFYADVAPGGTVVITGVGVLILVEAAAMVRRRTRRPAPAGPHVHAHISHAHGAVRPESASDGGAAEAETVR